MWNGAVRKLHSRSSTLCGVHSPTSSAIHSSPSSPALGIPNTPVSTTLCLSCALESPRAIPEARDLPLPCRGARGFQKPALLPFMLGLLETRVLTKFYSIQSLPRAGLARAPRSTGNRMASLRMRQSSPELVPFQGLN